MLIRNIYVFVNSNIGFLILNVVLSKVLFSLLTDITLFRTELTSGHIYDLMRFAIGCFSCWILSFIDASILYHFIKGQAVIKLYVIFNAIEVCT